MTICAHCGESFVPRYANLKLCYACYMKREKALAEYDDLIDEVAMLRQSLEYVRHQLALEQASRDRASTIPPDRLRMLIQLAHPDRHGGSQAANDATAWLLALRKRP